MAAAVPAPAAACDAPCPRPWVLTTPDGQVASGDVLSIRCIDCPPEPGPLEVVDAADQVTSGELRYVEQSVEPIWMNAASPLRYFTWTPNDALPPGAYRIRWATESSCTPPERTWTVPEASAQPGPVEPRLKLETRSTAAGTTFECAGACDPMRTSTRIVARPLVWVAPQIGLADPRFATHLARMVARTPHEELTGGWLDLDTLRVGEHMFLSDSALAFPERQSEYCATLELLDARSGQRERLPEVCMQDTLGELASAPNFTEVHACQLNGSRADYERAFCADNRDDCKDDETDRACQAWRERCDPDGGELDASAGADAGEPTGAGGGLQHEAAGCSLVAAGARARSPLAWVGLGLGALIRRRVRSRAR